MMDLFNEKIMKQIVDSGSNENGNWVKFADGTMICSNRAKYTIGAVNTKWGQLYASSAQTGPTFPKEFKEVPAVSCTLTSYFASWYIFLTTHSNKRLSDFDIVCPTNTVNSFDYYLDYIAIGKWK